MYVLDNQEGSKETRFMFWNRQTLREKPSRILEDWGKDKRRMQKKIDELEEIISGYSDKGFWGRACSRLTTKNKDLEAKLSKAVDMVKWIRLAVEEAENYIQMGKKLEEIVEYSEFKTLEEIGEKNESK